MEESGIPGQGLKGAELFWITLLCICSAGSCVCCVKTGNFDDVGREKKGGGDGARCLVWEQGLVRFCAACVAESYLTAAGGRHSNHARKVAQLEELT